MIQYYVSVLHFSLLIKNKSNLTLKLLLLFGFIVLGSLNYYIENIEFETATIEKIMVTLCQEFVSNYDSNNNNNQNDSHNHNNINNDENGEELIEMITSLILDIIGS